ARPPLAPAPPPRGRAAPSRRAVRAASGEDGAGVGPRGALRPDRRHPPPAARRDHAPERAPMGRRPPPLAAHAPARAPPPDGALRRAPRLSEPRPRRGRSPHLAAARPGAPPLDLAPRRAGGDEGASRPRPTAAPRLDRGLRLRRRSRGAAP